MRKIGFYLWIILATVGCSRYPAEVEKVLKLAGENRSELERVLEHYKHHPEDSLKLKSAYFLIANMPYHYAIHDAYLESFKSYLHDSVTYCSWIYYKDSHKQVHQKVEIKHDLHHMTAEFLIHNIDFSFQVWQETPWGKYISFDDFCADILPYRISHEPLEYWKEEYYAKFRPVIDSIEHGNRPEEICTRLLKYINEEKWIWGVDFNANGFGASILLYSRFGTCKEQAEFIAYILRALGIPSGIDITIHQPDNINPSHFWNYTRNNEGIHLGFDFTDELNLEGSMKLRKYGKIYRQCFALQKESLPVKFRGNYIPPGKLRDVLLRDVTYHYFPDSHISVQLESARLLDKKGLAFLCVFNNKEWVPVAGCKPKNGIAEFKNVEPKLLYQINWIDEMRNVALTKPFIFYSNDNLHFFDADTNLLQAMTLFRKYKFPLEWPFWVTQVVGGKFQGANRPDFSDSVTLHMIQKNADLSYVDVTPDLKGKFKYVRYLSAKGGFNCMAEAQFYSEGKRLKGEVIGTEGTSDGIQINNTKYAVFDNDPLSFYAAIESDSAWAGLAFDKSYQIDAIRYIFRNDDNNIRVGDTYELFYHRNRQWVSAGKQTADTTLLHYENVPSNTLYWLRNHTRGREERPFIYVEGKQIFY